MTRDQQPVRQGPPDTTVRLNPPAPVVPVLTSGKLYLDHGVPAGGVTLRFYRLAFGGVGVDLRKDAVTGQDGKYTVDWGKDGPPANLEVRAVTADGREIPLTGTIADVTTAGQLNLVAPNMMSPAHSEYVRLAADIGRHVPAGKLGDARAEDLTLLHHATGWDSEVIAHAVAAQRLAQRTGVDPQAFYGLLRAGLPADVGQLAWVSDSALSQALARAAKARIVSLTPDQVKAARASFAVYGRNARAQAIAPGTLSTLQDMLEAAGLTPEEQLRFDQLFASHQGRAAQLWQRAANEKLPVDRLRLASRLGYLTRNNAVLVAALREEAQTCAALGATLVDAGLYEAQAWTERLRSAANGDDTAVGALIPPAYTGQNTDERLASYAEDMARKVRLSYPTEIAGHQVGTDQIRLGDRHDEVKADVQAFLRSAPALGFELGRTPVSAFVAEHAGSLFGGMPADRVDAATKHVRMLASVHQISPTLQARKALLEGGITAALDVTAIPLAKFVANYEQLIGRSVAHLVHRQAWLVSNTTYTFYGAITQPPGWPATTPSTVDRVPLRAKLRAQFPTMAQLFGDLDFCECEHCRSVLSPAAYLVDLLKFLDPDAPTWRAELAWLAHHPDATRTGTPARPYDVLTKRRPDLPHLPLTCENTNTVLPYIDVVNEILEYYLANNHTLPSTADTVWDTGDADSADLIAEPQHLLPSVYDTLREAVFPIGAPFDLWWETVRRFAAHVDAPLWQLLEAFLGSDELSGTPYGRSAVCHERLGISAAEFAVLARDDPAAALPELYGMDGLSTGATVTRLRSAKLLAERLGVSYAELVSLLRTNFVNPWLDDLAALRKAGISVEDTARYHGRPGFPPFGAAQRAAFERRIGTRRVDWLRKTRDQQLLEKVLVLADPDPGCSFEQTTLVRADGTAADPIDLVKLSYFVRLLRRLKWTVEELDRALTVFLPHSPDPRSDALGVDMASALIGMSHLEALHQRLGVDRVELLRLWSPLDGVRYAELFLTGTEVTRDPVFDDALGNYLHDSSVLLGEHLAPVLAAFALTTDEVTSILADAGQQLDTAPLTIAVLSTLHRYRLLATAMSLSVADLITLKELCGIDPFSPPSGTPVTVTADDNAYLTVRFVQTADAVSASGLSVTALDYLLRHRFDPIGGYRPAADPPVALAGSLAADIRSIRDQYPAQADQARLIMALVVRTVSADRNADPGLTEALLTMPALLAVPGRPGAAIVDAYVEVGADDPSSGPDAAARTLHPVHELLSKALLLTGTLALSTAELTHLLTNAADFDGLDLGAMPTELADDPEPAQALFAQVMRLVGYARLRADLTAEPGELTEVFAAAKANGATLPDLCARFGRITRRDTDVVGRAALLLGMTLRDFADERGLRRLWQVLSLANRFGVDPEALHRWATPAPDQVVTRDLRDTLNAAYEPQAWRRVAKSVFDPLRALRRDALVSSIVHSAGYSGADQLYEHFLVDPGTEPEVRTSRLRLAISSVQLFVQRCLLNLEPDVHPSLVNAEHWQWMKRYRVWEANRKIFLYPENWLEPEFRDDKTHLFAALEDTLLQTDLSDDEADKALRDYLRGLEKIARLDIRAIYVEEKTDPAGNVLHVLARTYSSPHDYFYRTYAHGTWQPWIPVTAQIVGDHVVTTVWRGRLYVFWVTFVEKAVLKDTVDNPLGPHLRHVAVQLHWTEYFHGAWTPPSASDLLDDSTDLSEPFDPNAMFVFANPRPADPGDHGAMWVNLSGRQFSMAIRLTSPNAPAGRGALEPVAAPPLLPPPYPQGGGRWLGAQTGLSVHYRSGVVVVAGQQIQTCETTDTILGKGAFPIIVSHPQYLAAAAARDVGLLLNPFFYSDDSAQHTYYVEPSLQVTTITESDEVVVSIPPRRLSIDESTLAGLRFGARHPTPRRAVAVEPISRFARFPLRSLSTSDLVLRTDVTR